MEIKNINMLPNDMEKSPDSKIIPGSKTQKTIWIGFWTDVDTKYIYYLFFLSLIVRLFIINEPSSVVFDEVHFGGFASNYLNRNYYMDVHPPLAKMLVALTGWISDLSLDFRFDLIGVDYIEANVPYIFMRLVPAILGAMMVPLAYIILRSMHATPRGALWTSLLVLFENAFVTQFRFILLDAYLAFGTATAFASYCLFRERDAYDPFSVPWWFWITSTGIFLGFTVSCKWVGIFTIATIGILSAIEMWFMLGNVNVPMKKYSIHFLSRIFFFLVIPTLIYIFTFYAHFLVLSNIGLHGTEMSTEFQQDFHGSDYKPTFEDVGIGSIIALRHHSLHECLLHSHGHLYPSGSKQQQVTLYSTKDDNNLWRILPAWYTMPRESGNQTLFVPLRHGDIIRLEHLETGSFLHSHPVEPPISHKDHHFEVSCYGSASQGIGDTNDHWRVEITDSDGTILYYNGERITSDGYLVSESAYKPVSQIVDSNLTETSHICSHYKPRIRARRTLIRLIHVNTGCYLTSFAKKLPEWGFGQLEVTCGRDSLKKKAVWVIDTNENPNLPENAKMTSYRKLGFIQKFAELQLAMWQRNEALTADHYFGSRPSSWFVLNRGLGFWNGVMAHKRNLTISETVEQDSEANQQRITRNTIWQHGSYIEDQNLKVKNKGRQIYLLGNPITWWFVSSVIISYVILIGLLIFIDHRKVHIIAPDSPVRITSIAGFFLIAWSLHYFPFFIMKRQLFLHHYLPAYYFGILLAGYLMDYFIWSKNSTITNILWILTICSIVYVFVQFSPLSYGLKMSREHCISLRWLQNWDFDCDSTVSEIMPKITNV